MRPVTGSRLIVQELEEYLRETRVRHVHFCDGTHGSASACLCDKFPAPFINPGGMPHHGNSSQRAVPKPLSPFVDTPFSFPITRGTSPTGQAMWKSLRFCSE